MLFDPHFLAGLFVGVVAGLFVTTALFVRRDFSGPIHDQAEEARRRSVDAAVAQALDDADARYRQLETRVRRFPPPNPQNRDAHGFTGVVEDKRA
jgi:hypothetical protein